MQFQTRLSSFTSSNYLSVCLLLGLTACNTVPVEPTLGKTVVTEPSPAPIVSQTNSSQSPAKLIPAGMSLLSSFKYDFNRDGMADWVIVAKQEVGNGFYIRPVFVYLSQPNGQYQQLVQSPFESAWPASRQPGLTVKLQGNDLLIISGPEKFSDLPPTNGPNEISLRQSYLFQYTQNDFILQQYTHGSSFVYQGKVTHDSYIFDLPTRAYRGNRVGKQRCDFTPNQVCKDQFAWNKTVASYPILSLSSFKRFDSETIRELSKATQ